MDDWKYQNIVELNLNELHLLPVYRKNIFKFILFLQWTRGDQRLKKKVDQVLSVELENVVLFWLELIYAKRMQLCKINYCNFQKIKSRVKIVTTTIFFYNVKNKYIYHWFLFLKPNHLSYITNQMRFFSILNRQIFLDNFFSHNLQSQINQWID